MGTTYRQLESLHDIVIVWLVVILLIVRVVSYGVFSGNKGNLLPDSEVLEKT
jgi:hypothetical protein